MVLFLIVLLQGCKLPACRDLCAQKADCLEAEIATYGSTWSEWTGFSGREDYEDACFEVFANGLREDANRREERRVCKAEREYVCPQ